MDIEDLNPSSRQPQRNDLSLWRQMLPSVSPDAHKYQRGHCLVASGPELSTGASRLSAVAALNAGCGAVTITGELAALRIHATHLTAIMLRQVANSAEFGALLQNGRFNSVVIGPGSGLGAQTRKKVDAALHSGIAAVFDADALTSLDGDFDALRLRPHHLQAVVLTPHEGEFERLFGDLGQDAIFKALAPVKAATRVERACAAARLSGSVVVLKGRGTIIAAPDGRVAIDDNGGPELATAGSGDVLAGIIGSHLAQGMPAFEAAAAGVWLHGVSGALVGVGLTADKLAQMITPVERRLMAKEGG